MGVAGATGEQETRDDRRDQGRDPAHQVSHGVGVGQGVERDVLQRVQWHRLAAWQRRCRWHGIGAQWSGVDGTDGRRQMFALGGWRRRRGSGEGGERGPQRW